MIIFRTELEVAEQQSNLGCRDQQDRKHNQQETEHVVVPARPDAAQDEEQLHEASSKGENPANEDCEPDIHEPRLIRDLPRDVGGVDRELNGVLLVAKVGAKEHERDGDAEPQDHDHQHDPEGDGVGRAVNPAAPSEAKTNRASQTNWVG